ncbi:MAG: bifunctional isocitrate dehydrogenase kinase/phosphatase [Gammaproteobacteria bacterium]
MDEERKKLIRETAATIFRCFVDYNEEFGAITRRADRRFAEREWKLGQRDAVERIELYDRRVHSCVAGLVGPMGSAIADQATWRLVRIEYSKLIADCVDNEFYKTFFNSLTRKAFNTVGVNSHVEYLAPDLAPTLNGSEPPLSTFSADAGLEPAIVAMLRQFPPHRAFRDRDGSVKQVVAEIEAYTGRRFASPIGQIDVLTPVFYRATRAFLVGRISGGDWVSALVLALENTDDGIVVDTVMMADYEVRNLFGFSRSYFHVDLPAVGAAVKFLGSMIPQKTVAEFYTVLGRAKQGKTERYRRLHKYLQDADDQFIEADGEKGMVMIAFTLRDYGLIFKVIRDHFAYPKDTTRDKVMERYQFVFKHDRVGRLVDAQEFRRLRFAKQLFAGNLLEELLGEASDTCRVDGDDLILEHCYIERRLRPLNLYLQEVDPAVARRAVIDYGQAIKDLARTNVFPGDLLVKNFGVTRNGRVIFYDYDELCLVTDCTFRDLPSARFEEDEMRAEAWFHVGKEDVFPEQFVNFLGMGAELREAFLGHHADLMTADYWRDLKRRHEAEQLLEVVPYASRSALPPNGLTT